MYGWFDHLTDLQLGQEPSAELRSHKGCTENIESCTDTERLIESLDSCINRLEKIEVSMKVRQNRKGENEVCKGK